MYKNTAIDKLKKSKKALCACGSGFAIATALIITVCVLLLLTIVGVHQYEQQLSFHSEKYDLSMTGMKTCHICDLLPGSEVVTVCQQCTSTVLYSTMKQSLNEWTLQDTRVAIHEAIGWLWNWIGITWPTMLLTHWVYYLFNVSIWVTVANFGCTCVWIIYLIYQWLLAAPISAFTDTMERAELSAPSSFKKPVSFNTLLEKQTLTINDDEMVAYDALRQRNGFRV